MDFQQAIKIATSSSAYLNLNSITAAPTVGTQFSGYLTETVSYANAGVSGFVESIAQRDGVEANIALLNARSVQLVVQVYGSSSADFYDKLNALNSALQPYPSFASADDGFRALDFTQGTVVTSSYSASGIPLRLKVRPVALPAYTLQNDPTTPRTSDRGISTKAAINLIAKDPRKICQTAKTGTLVNSSTATVTNEGNYTAYPTLTFVNAGSQQTATISTSAWTSVFVIPAATTVSVDAEKRRVLVGTTLRMDLVLGTTTSFPYLSPGGNAITVAGMTSATLSYSFNEAWL